MSYQYIDSYKENTSRQSYLYNGNYYNGKDRLFMLRQWSCSWVFLGEVWCRSADRRLYEWNNTSNYGCSLLKLGLQRLNNDLFPRVCMTWRCCLTVRWCKDRDVPHQWGIYDVPLPYFDALWYILLIFANDYVFHVICIFWNTKTFLYRRALICYRQHSSLFIPPTINLCRLLTGSWLTTTSYGKLNVSGER